MGWLLQAVLSRPFGWVGIQPAVIGLPLRPVLELFQGGVVGLALQAVLWRSEGWCSSRRSLGWRSGRCSKVGALGWLLQSGWRFALLELFQGGVIRLASLDCGVHSFDHTFGHAF